MDIDIKYHLKDKQSGFNYSKIANSDILTTLFRFKDYIETLSMKNITMLQTLVDNITSDNNNLSYGLALILVQTRNSIIDLMTCHGDSTSHRRHPLLLELGQYDYTPILPSFITQDDPEYSQIISKMISICTYNRKHLLPLDDHIQNSQTSGLGVRKVDISAPSTQCHPLSCL